MNINTYIVKPKENFQINQNNIIHTFLKKRYYKIYQYKNYYKIFDGAKIVIISSTEVDERFDYVK